MHSLKYTSSTTLGCKDKGILKSELVAKAIPFYELLFVPNSKLVFPKTLSDCALLKIFWWINKLGIK